MYIMIVILALLIIGSLAFYAGALLFKLKSQRQLQTKTRQQRILKISESIQGIAKAVEQQQCNLSEASIRLFHLLEGLPLLEKPNFHRRYPGLYSLYNQIKHLPTHKERQTQSKSEIKQQDTFREELEAKLASQILSEVSALKTFSI